MKKVTFVRRVKGVVTEKGSTDEPAFQVMKKRHPGQYFSDDGTTPLPRPKMPAVPVPPKPTATGLPDFETLTDALIAFLDGDESELKAIRTRRKRALAPKKRKRKKD